MKLSNKKLVIVSTLVVVLILLAALFVTKSYPTIFIGADYISARQLDRYLTISSKLDSNSTDQQATDQLIKIYKERKLISELSLNDSREVFENEFDFLTQNNQEEYQALIKQYFSNEQSLFEEFVVKPLTYDALLRTAYNSDFNLNKEAYQKAQDILKQLNEGKIFEDVAKSQSDDLVSGQLGGDLGFVKENQILPELMNAVENSKIGEVKKEIVISRVGYHVLYPVESSEQDGKKVWHVKHILVETEGFEPWLKDQLAKYSAKKIFN